MKRESIRTAPVVAACSESISNRPTPASSSSRSRGTRPPATASARGPEAIRTASRQVDLYDPDFAELGLAAPWRHGIFMAPTTTEVETRNTEARRLVEPILARGGGAGAGASDLGDNLTRVNELSRINDDWVHDQVRRRLDQGKVVGVVGGDHSVALGAIRAHAAAYPGLGLLHIDAHADLRPAYEGFERSHASILDNVLRTTAVTSLTQVAIRDLCDREVATIDADDRITTFYDRNLQTRRFAGDPWSTLCREIVETLPETVYVTFDVDGLDPGLCPHTGTPVPGGLGFAEAIHLLTTLPRLGRRVIGFDLTEVAPARDATDEWDANVGARLLYRLCAVAMLGHGAGTGRSG